MISLKSEYDRLVFMMWVLKYDVFFLRSVVLQHSPHSTLHLSIWMLVLETMIRSSTCLLKR